MNTVIKDFFDFIQRLDDKEYLDAIVKYHTCALSSGIKPASLIRFSNYGRNLLDLWNRYKQDICVGGIEFFEIKSGRDEVLILFYKPCLLKVTLTDKENYVFLQQFGYGPKVIIRKYLSVLRNRFSMGLPHEVGIFLGIPLEDVQGFILNSGKNCLFDGYWKVYDNTQKAIKTFEQYDTVKLELVQKITESRCGGHE